mgnify:CR=1 FL=1
MKTSFLYRLKVHTQHFKFYHLLSWFDEDRTMDRFDKKEIYDANPQLHYKLKSLLLYIECAESKEFLDFDS